MGSPSVILTSQFTVPSANSFTTYMQYITRKEAIEKNSKEEISLEEQKELEQINKAILEYDMRFEIGETTLSRKKKLDKKEEEALAIIKGKSDFLDPENDFAKYISYMSRYYALEKKEAQSEKEKKEQESIRKKIYEVSEQSKEISEDDKVVSGVFTIDKEKPTKKDIEAATETVKAAQKNGSVFYQDVISFDTDFLIKEKLLDPKTNELNEKRLQEASRKMMGKMFEDENMEGGYWIASIHRNTDNIHIHYGTVENKSTRKIIATNRDGIETFEPKGKRKQKTIDNMKSTFANTLIDRTAELSRISDLRNKLVQDIKVVYQFEKGGKEIKLINDLYDELPINKKDWQYGNKNLKEDTRDKIDLVTDSLMRSNPDYKEYIERVKEEGHYRKELFGESNREDKDYEKNKTKDIRKRLGNSLLKEMKKQSDTIYISKHKEHKTENNYFGNHNRPYLRKVNLFHFQKAINDDYEKYRAEKDYEYLQQRIAMEAERNSL